MTYSFQSFSIGQVLTAAAQNQVEVNVRDHIHGQNSVADWYVGVADAGSTDSYAITVAAAPGAYVTGMTIFWKANTANTGPATLNVNSLGAKSIKKNKDVQLIDNDLKAGSWHICTYDGTNFQLISDPAAAVAPDPQTVYELHEDFQALRQSAFAAASGGDNIFGTGVWYTVGGVTRDVETRGRITITADGTNAGGLSGPMRITSGTQGTDERAIVLPSENPILTFRIANSGAGSVVKRFGAHGDLGSGADPANGIYIRWTNGNYLLVCRASSVETTLDTGIASSSTLRVFTISIGTASVEVFVDGVSKGTISTNIPTGAMFINARTNAITTTNGFTVEYVNLRFSR